MYYYNIYKNTAFHIIIIIDYYNTIKKYTYCIRFYIYSVRKLLHIIIYLFLLFQIKKKWRK